MQVNALFSSFALLWLQYSLHISTGPVYCSMPEAIFSLRVWTSGAFTATVCRPIFSAWNKTSALMVSAQVFVRPNCSTGLTAKCRAKTTTIADAAFRLFHKSFLWRSLLWVVALFFCVYFLSKSFPWRANFCFTFLFVESDLSRFRVASKCSVPYSLGP